MFTREGIQAAQAAVRSGADYPQFVDALRTMGVQRYVHAVADGRVVYHGAAHAVTVPSTQPVIPVASHGSESALRRALSAHQQGESDFPTFCAQAGSAGVGTWTCDLQSMEVTYTDSTGSVLLVEAIPSGR